MFLISSLMFSATKKSMHANTTSKKAVCTENKLPAK
jgi:hypothetical protein